MYGLVTIAPHTHRPIHREFPTVKPPYGLTDPARIYKIILDALAIDHIGDNGPTLSESSD